MTAAQAVLFSVEDGVATVSLNRPERFNAMTDDLMRGISEAIDKVREDQSVRVVVLSGNGRGFCAGADLQQAAVPEPAPAAATATDSPQDKQDT